MSAWRILRTDQWLLIGAPDHAGAPTGRMLRAIALGFLLISQAAVDPGLQAFRWAKFVCGPGVACWDDRAAARRLFVWCRIAVCL